MRRELNAVDYDNVIAVEACRLKRFAFDHFFLVIFARFDRADKADYEQRNSDTQRK